MFHQFPQLVYNANNGSSGVNSILVELDASNTGTAGVALTCFIQDTSATLGSITSIVSSSDIATVTTGSAHGLSVGQYVMVTGSTTAFVNGMYKVASVPSATTFTYAQNSGASNGTADWYKSNLQSISHCKRCYNPSIINTKDCVWTKDCS